MIMYDNDCYIFYQIDTVKLFHSKAILSAEKVSAGTTTYMKYSKFFDQFFSNIMDAIRILHYSHMFTNRQHIS